MGLGRSRMITFASLALIGGAVAVFGFGVPFRAPLQVAVLVAIPLLLMGPHGVSALGDTHGGVRAADISATART